MDYIDIILRGYSNENDRKFLNKYFIRECKKAKEQHYDFEVFFSGLVNGIDRIKKEYEKPFYKRKNELYFMLEGAKNKTLKYADLDTKSIDEKHNETIEYCESELSDISFENFPINLLQFTNDRYRGNLFYSEVNFINNEIAKAFKELNTPQQPKAKKKKILTNDTYFDILEQCTIEAFESLKIKDYYPQNGSKAIWDTSSLTISKGNGQLTDRDIELYRTEYIKENMRVTFLTALDKHWKKFEKKNLQTRSYFYKKCYQSLLFKISESPLWKKPDLGIDINNPCVLSFIWNMRRDIEARSIEPTQTKPQHPESNNKTIENKINFENKFDKVNEIKVFEYFKTNLVDKKYISEITLNEFLNLAFEKRELPKQKFSFERLNTQNDIVKVFYNYFKITAGKPYGRQPEYLNLLKNYFIGFEKTNIRNFSK